MAPLMIKSYTINSPIIFLDIDGVLNAHQFNNRSESCNIDTYCVHNLNRILAQVPNSLVVLSSAWRYLVHSGAMTTYGFSCMMRVFGVCASISNRLIDITKKDEDISNRGNQIAEWRLRNGHVGPYVILDDLDNLGIRELHPNNFIQTDGTFGLTINEIDDVIKLLENEK